MDRFNKLDWAFQRDRISNAYRVWFVNLIVGEQNSIGGPNLEALVEQDRLVIEPFDTNKSTKGQLIRALALALERMEYRWLPDDVARGELEAYEATVSRITGHVAYSAPEGINDDTVIARALALWGCTNGSRQTSPVYTPYSQIGVSVMVGGGGVPPGMLGGGRGRGEPGWISYGTAEDLSGYNAAMKPPPGRPW